MNPLVQTSNQSPEISDRNMHAMQVGLMVIPHQTRKSVTPLVLFGFKTQKQP